MENNNETNPENSSKTLLGAIKVILVEGCSNTTAHALPNIFRTNNIFLKIIWFICFLTSTGYFISTMVTALNNYYSYSSYISTKIIQETVSQFPAITVCNIKTINKAKAFSIAANSANKVLNTTYSQPYDLINGIIFTTRIEFNSNLNETTRKEMGYEMKDMFMSCLFNYDSCSSNDFEYYYHPMYGNCYTFNHGVNGTLNNIKTVTTANGAYSGLILELFVGNQDETYYEFNNGLLISIHNQSSLPFTNGDKIKVASGSETDIIIDRNFISKLEAPYGNCVKDTTSNSKTVNSVYFDYIVKTLGITYSREYCFNLCIQDKIINQCKCANIMMPTFKNTTKFCQDLMTEIICMMNIVKNFDKNNSASDCSTLCPYECESIEYVISTYTTQYPNYYFSQVLLAYATAFGYNINSSYVDKAFVKLNVFYKSLEYTSITENVSTSPEDLFSNIGGTVGLCIGISILSLVEVFEVIFNIIVTIIGHIKSKNQKITSSSSTTTTTTTQDSIPMADNKSSLFQT